MSPQKKKEKSVATRDRDEDLLVELADFTRETIQEGRESSSEAFDVYTHQLKGKFVSNEEKFRTRFSKGYHALINELQQH